MMLCLLISLSHAHTCTLAHSHTDTGRRFQQIQPHHTSVVVSFSQPAMRVFCSLKLYSGVESRRKQFRFLFLFFFI